METAFRLELDDWNAFLKAVKARGAQIWILAPMLLIGTVLPMLADRRLQLRFRYGGIEAVWPHLAAYMVPLVLLTVFFVAISYFQKQQLKKQPMFAGPITIKADDEGISGTSTVGRDTIFWPAIHKIIETDAHFFVLNAPQGGLIIPKRAFASNEEAARFGAFLNDSWAAHRPEVAPIAPPQ
ncbi:MAG: YcxB family protein [Armatimonadetes bacterium]|nr:YcxB family protein [Armatimonadota bacterium]